MRKRTAFYSAGLLLVFLLPNLVLARQTKSKKYVFDVTSNKLLVARLDIDISSDFRIRPNPDSRQIIVDITYNPEKMDVDADFDSSSNHLYVSVDVEGWTKGFKNDEDSGTCTVYFPLGVPIELNSTCKAGEINFDLGGLSIENVDLRLAAGTANIRFREPNPIQMDDLSIDGKIGELDLQKLGNAGFQTAEISTAIGELSIDLSGSKKIDFSQDVTVDVKIGETNLTLPEDRPIKLRISKFLFLSQSEIPDEFEQHGGIYIHGDVKNAKNLLYLRISPGLGALNIDWE
ncbi:MAG: DUF4097 domain-containing protein [Calditrichaeota bacterium]|nr:DUF4097 domain-containing protein [Calditrichota bacterium]